MMPLGEQEKPLGAPQRLYIRRAAERYSRGVTWVLKASFRRPVTLDYLL